MNTLLMRVSRMEVATETDYSDPMLKERKVTRVFCKQVGGSSPAGITEAALHIDIPEPMPVPYVLDQRVHITIAAAESPLRLVAPPDPPKPHRYAIDVHAGDDGELIGVALSDLPHFEKVL